MFIETYADRSLRWIVPRDVGPDHDGSADVRPDGPDLRRRLGRRPSSASTSRRGATAGRSASSSRRHQKASRDRSGRHSPYDDELATLGARMMRHSASARSTEDAERALTDFVVAEKTSSARAGRSCRSDRDDAAQQTCSTQSGRADTCKRSKRRRAHRSRALVAAEIEAGRHATESQIKATVNKARTRGL